MERLILELYHLGAPDRAISRIVGISAPLIRRCLNGHSLPIQPDTTKYWTSHQGTAWEEMTPIRLKHEHV